MLSTKNLTKRGIPNGIPFSKIAETILGKRYDASLTFVTPALSKKLNTTYRHKNKATNVLAFPLGKLEGEVVINLTQTKAEAKKYSRTYEEHLAALFIHGSLHLKGFTHGSTMERVERQLVGRFVANG